VWIGRIQCATLYKYVQNKTELSLFQIVLCILHLESFTTYCAMTQILAKTVATLVVEQAASEDLVKRIQQECKDVRDVKKFSSELVHEALRVLKGKKAKVPIAELTQHLLTVVQAFLLGRIISTKHC
jgi:hypothetical protein